jgi:hypothetical protein
VPRPPAEWSEETAAAFELAMREYDMMHKRLTAETPEAAPFRPGRLQGRGATRTPWVAFCGAICTATRLEGLRERGP